MCRLSISSGTEIEIENDVVYREKMEGKKGDVRSDLSRDIFYPSSLLPRQPAWRRVRSAVRRVRLGGEDRGFSSWTW